MEKEIEKEKNMNYMAIFLKLNIYQIKNMENKQKMIKMVKLYLNVNIDLLKKDWKKYGNK